jgi:hypothetical protein
MGETNGLRAVLVPHHAEAFALHQSFERLKNEWETINE